MSRVRRVMRSVERTVRKRGIVGTVRYAAERLRNRGAGPAHEPTVTDAAEDQDFDSKYGVSTGGEIAQTELDVKDKNWIHGSAYVPTSPVDLDKVLSGLGLTFEDTSFVDLGAGKGRVLLMAAALPFKRIVGVEFSSQLADVARDNARKYTGPRACKEILVETMDATKYRFPDGPLVVFMYHPFDETIMAQVEKSLRAVIKNRRVLVVYFKPVHREVWDRSTAFDKKREEKLFTIYEARRSN